MSEHKMTDWLLTLNKNSEACWQEVVNNQLSPVSDAPKPKRNDRVFVSVPGSLICSLQKQLPPLPKKNQEQVAGYAIEDQIASSLESVKIAARQDKTGKTSLLWCDQQQLQAWQQLLSSHISSSPARLLPDYLYLPLIEKSWTLSLCQDQVLLRTGLATGLSLDTDNFFQTLPLLLEESGSNIESITYDNTSCVESLQTICKKYKIDLIHQLSFEFCYPDKSIVSLGTNSKSMAHDRSSTIRKTNQSLATIWLVALLAGGIGYYFSHTTSPTRSTSTQHTTKARPKASIKDRDQNTGHKLLMHATGKRPRRQPHH